VPALDFTLEHRDVLFPKIPIVFCSAPEKLAESPFAFTGKIRDVNIQLKQAQP
jgi:hypothetical protein